MGRRKGSTAEIVRTRTHKICGGQCKQDKPLTEFHRSAYKSDGHQGECKECRNARKREEWHAKNSKQRERVKDRSDAARALIQREKKCPCADCGIEYPAPVMHFHHRDPSQKFKTVCSLVNHSEETILAEIAKCDVLCANCHAMRHYISS